MQNPHIHPFQRAKSESEATALKLLQRLTSYTGRGFQPTGEEVRIAEEMVAKHGLELCLQSVVFAFKLDDPRPDGTLFWAGKVVDPASLAKALDGDLARQTLGYAQKQKYKVESNGLAGEMIGSEYFHDNSRLMRQEVIVVEDGQQYDDAVTPYEPKLTDLIAGPCQDPNCLHGREAFEGGRPGCTEHFCVGSGPNKGHHRCSPSFQARLLNELKQRRPTCEFCHGRMWVWNREVRYQGVVSIPAHTLIHDCYECRDVLDQILGRDPESIERKKKQRERGGATGRRATERSFTANANADIDAIKP